jgi:hypothetical protein
MTTTITRTSDSATTSPTLVLGYDTTRTGRNVIHNLIGGGIAVTLVPPAPRSGTLQLFYPAEADAWAALALHETADSFTLVNDERPGIGMTYVLDGGITLTLDPETRDLWTLAVDYQEVEP